MNRETTGDTPETDAAWDAHQMDSTCDDGDPWGLASKLERERDEAKKLLESSKRARASLNEACDHLQRERDSLREALSACMEDSIELLGEREWWKDESRSGYAERYAQTVENIREAQALLATPKNKLK